MRVVASLARVARDTGAVARWLRRAPLRVRLALRDAQESHARAATANRAPTAEERRDQLIGFYGRYEALVEALCDGAQYGPDSTLEQRYQEHRAWMQRHYPAMRGYLRPYLEDGETVAKGRIEHHERQMDAFESLFGYPTLTTLLQHDDGDLIGAIVRTRQAVNRYGEHLRQMQRSEDR